MAKYDQYSVSYTSASLAVPVKRDLTVLFEEGDNPAMVIEQAETLILPPVPTAEDAVEEFLINLSEQETINLLFTVWVVQMAKSGVNKNQYTKDLINAVNDADNA